MDTEQLKQTGERYEHLGDAGVRLGFVGFLVGGAVLIVYGMIAGLEPRAILLGEAMAALAGAVSLIVGSVIAAAGVNMQQRARKSRTDAALEPSAAPVPQNWRDYRRSQKQDRYQWGR